MIVWFAHAQAGGVHFEYLVLGVGLVVLGVMFRLQGNTSPLLPVLLIVGGAAAIVASVAL